jgi:hypothetical protein
MSGKMSGKVSGIVALAHGVRCVDNEYKKVGPHGGAGIWVFAKEF